MHHSDVQATFPQPPPSAHALVSFTGSMHKQAGLLGMQDSLVTMNPGKYLDFWDGHWIEASLPSLLHSFVVSPGQHNFLLFFLFRDLPLHCKDVPGSPRVVLLL